MGFHTPFKAPIALLLAICVLFASPGLMFPQAPTSTTPAAKAPSTAAKVPPPGGDPWPRQFTYQDAKISVYQPALSDWTGNKLDAYSAVLIRTGKDKTDFGVIWYTARTEVDKVNRVVTLADFQLARQNFPTIANNGAAYAGAFNKDMTWTQSVPLDELQSSLAVTSVAEKQQKVEVKNNPPTIFFSTAPAVLALIDGQPVMQDAGHGLQKIINTRALILFDPDKSMYYLALMDGWVESNTHTGNGVGYNDNSLYASHDGTVYRGGPSSGWQQNSGSGWSNATKPTSSFNDEAAARDQGSQRWNNFHSGGWGGGWGGGFSDHSGGWGGGGWDHSGGFSDGGFHGGWGGGCGGFRGGGGFRR